MDFKLIIISYFLHIILIGIKKITNETAENVNKKQYIFKFQKALTSQALFNTITIQHQHV